MKKGKARKRNTERLNRDLGYLEGVCHSRHKEFSHFLWSSRTKTPSLASTFLGTLRTSQWVFVKNSKSRCWGVPEHQPQMVNLLPPLFSYIQTGSPRTSESTPRIYSPNRFPITKSASQQHITFVLALSFFLVIYPYSSVQVH